MKKIISLFAILIAFVTVSYAQVGTVTFTLLTPPCDTNGVLVAHFPVGTPPFRVVYWGGITTGSTAHVLVTGLTDTLYNYTGAPVTVTVDSIGYAPLYDTGTFTGAPPFTYTFNPIPPFCGASTPISVSVLGGIPPYTYSWQHIYPYAYVGSGNPITLPAGQYEVTITDASGCEFGAFRNPYNTNIDTIMSTPTFSLITGSDVANCTDGKAWVSIGGGTSAPPYTYLWSDGATTDTISGLTMGSYHVTVTDSLGCIATRNVYVSQSVTISVYTTVTPATCLASNGAIIAFGSGGHHPYSYLWSDGATTQGQTGIAAGNYYITITDSNGCIGTGGSTVSVSSPITVTYTATPSSCTTPTGTATLTYTGGTAPYTDTFYTSPIQTGATATGLAPGTYSFKVTDSAGCVRTGSVVVPPMDIISLGMATTPALCTLANGSISVAASGGVAPYSYSWSSGGTTASLTSQPAGYYVVTVTDANGCKATNCASIFDNSPVAIGFATTPATCIFVADAHATAVATGGTAPYTWYWNTGATTATISGLATGNYYVSCTDATGCHASNHTFLGYNAYDSSCFCMIKGNVYYDINDNCTKDLGEPGVHHIQIYCSGGIGYTYTDDSGNYYFLVPSGTYTITETVLAFYPLSSCQANNIVVTASAATGCVIPVNFANSINPIQPHT